MSGENRSIQMVTRLRRVLDKSQMATLPGHRAARAVKAFNGTSNAVSPKIWAATARTQCSGCTTRHRMQRSSPCLFGCAHGEDSIAQYARCSKLAFPMRNKLGFTLPRTVLAWTTYCCWDHLLILLVRTSSPCVPWECPRRLWPGKESERGHAAHATDTWTQYFKEGASSYKGLSDDIRALWNRAPPRPPS